MTDLIDSPAVPTGQPLEGCASCGAPLAGDQRWCLNCGTRRAGVDTPFSARASTPPPAPAPAPVPAPTVVPVRPVDGPPRWLVAVLALGLAAVLFAVGLVVGLSGQDRRTLVNIPPGKAPVVNITNTPASAVAALPVAGADTTPAACGEDWPKEKEGWTVQLQTLPGDATGLDADTAKTEAEGKGAAEVGALLSDDFASLEPDKCVIFSGMYDAKGAAKSALGELSKDFPKAEVVQVSATGADAKPVETVSAEELEQTQSDDPEEQQEASEKLPEKVGTEGTPPPEDNVAPGGGGEGTQIG